MNENIDLTKILDGCPEGTEFYCSLYGVVKFVRISATNWIIISTKIGNKCISKMGRFDEELFSDDECIFFPSKEQRDWSKFERFWDKPKIEKFDPKTFKPFDKVLGFYEVEGGSWECAIFSHLIGKERSAICAGIIYTKCIPYNEETKHLIGTNNDCPEYYKWWEE